MCDHNHFKLPTWLFVSHHRDFLIVTPSLFYNVILFVLLKSYLSFGHALRRLFGILLLRLYFPSSAVLFSLADRINIKIGSSIGKPSLFRISGTSHSIDNAASRSLQLTIGTNDTIHNHGFFQNVALNLRQSLLVDTVQMINAKYPVVTDSKGLSFRRYGR